MIAVGLPVGRKASAFLGRGYKAPLSFPSQLLYVPLSERPMVGQPKSKASSWSSAEVGLLWEEPTEAISGKQTERP